MVGKGKPLGDQLAEILDGYSKEVQEKADKQIRNVAAATANRLRHTSPVGRTGKYAKGWAYKRTKYGEIVVYNATDWQLTHLLEFGHALPQGGRARAFPHIAPAEEKAEEDLMNRIERVLKK